MTAAEEVDPDQLAHIWAIYRAARDIEGPAAFTTAWLDLPVDDVRRRAALVRGAWYWECVERGLASPAGCRGLEDLIQREVSHELRAASQAVAGAEDWTAAARDSRYNRAALRRRAEALRPRPNDYQGGPVDWATGQPLQRERAA